MKALRQGLHVFLFSDNVPLEQERAIKALARAKGLLVMGPDCGTAILRGIPLGFANVVREGAISLVGASGTGLQEVTCQIHAHGHGIRHAIGTGGRDVSAEIGGSTMRQAIDLLAADPAHARDRHRLEAARARRGAASPRASSPRSTSRSSCCSSVRTLPASGLAKHIVPVTTLHDAAAAAVALLEGQGFAVSQHHPECAQIADGEARRLVSGQRYLRGLYSGGTFRTEARRSAARRRHLGRRRTPRSTSATTSSRLAGRIR